MADVKFESFNAKSARQLVIEKNSALEYFNIKDKEGKNRVFFTCGDITGYVSPAARKAISDGCGIDALKYAEVSKDGGNPIPCLMVVGAGHAPTKVIGAELLRE